MSLSVTNTFVSGVSAVASQVNTNFTDITTWLNNKDAGSTTWGTLQATSATLVPGIFNNSTGTQDILRCQDNGSNVLVVPNGGIITMAGQSAARAYKGTNQTILAGATQKLVFSTKSYDVQTEFDAVTNNRFTATVTGKYLVTSSTQVQGVTTTGLYSFIIYVNGAAVSNTNYYLTAGKQQVLTVTDVLSLAATDYVEIYFTNPDGANGVTLIGSSTSVTYVAIHKLS